MKWFVKELSEYKNQPLSTSEDINLSDDIMSRYSKYVISADDDIHVEAHVFYEKGDVIVNAHVTGKVVVPSSRSLKPVDLPLDFTIDEVYVDTQARLKEREREDDVAFLVDDDGLIDFDQSVADNIILQIPMHILSPDEIESNEMPEGNDWAVISEDDFAEQEANDKKVDPRLAKLENFFNDSDN
ncbi:MAG: DUF177 domain-containing protein [Apilactobacillus sp.]|uniref:YceD family protein n=1 Tax=Apilactobacillus TaxID=2767877 RepID=UPI0025F61A52|nr:DUF177 domain-containing protein [Apilactobacillus sp.]MCT6822286.1 DUF177 domain-containing protein [Apilactobacillus sp.]MCT6858799.1 DUF177 domain-containing protein [Apilactobacillus sp.]